MNEEQLKEELSIAHHRASYLAQQGGNIKRWLGELEKQKRDAGLDYIAGCIRRDILIFENAADDVRKACDEHRKAIGR